jgi:NADPH:quinone reductase-like Zn-dependent oxidoreductase
MKAIIFDHYGPPEDLTLHEVPAPVPGGHQVLLEVRAAALNAADWHVMRADPLLVRLMCGLFKPRVRRLGADVSGVVLAVGPAVTRFKAGDEVFGCLPVGSWGSYAEQVCAPEDALALKPAQATFDEAAAVPLAGLTALQALRDVGQLQPGQKALVNGASGGVGTLAVQIAKALGAVVTAVCSSRNVDLARSLGADHVIDYSKEDFTQQGQRYDVIVAANGYHPLAAYKRVLSPQGRYAMVGGAGRQMAEAILMGPWLSEKGGRRLGRVDMKSTRADLQFLADLLETGKLKPVIDRRYSLPQVPEAIRYLEEGHARGKVVITVSVG